MALVLADRVQETSTTAGTGALTLSGAVGGFQSFAVVGNGNTCYYTVVDGTEWEVGIGTYSTTGPTLARTTVLSNSSGTTSPLSLSSAAKPVFLTYPSEKSVNLDASGNVSPLGTIASGTWQGSTVGVAYGGTGVTSSSGANSVMLRDANQNVSINRLNQSSTTVTAAGGTTTLTAASTFSQILVGTGTQTFQLPDATTLTNTTTFEFNNNATGNLLITDYATGAVGTISPGGAAAIALLANGTVAGTWDVHAYIPENVTWGTNSLALGSTVITGGTWNGGTIAPAYGGTGLTSYTSGGAIYATGTSTLTSGTLPIASGGTGATTASGARTSLDVPSTTGSGASGTWGINITGSAGSAGSSTTALRVIGGNLTPAGTTFNNALISASGSSRVVTFDGNGLPPSVWWSSGSTAIGAIDAISGGGLSFWANNGSNWQQQMAVNYGNVTINTDIRSPIYYDSNNTAYYVDPASTSTLQVINSTGQDVAYSARYDVGSGAWSGRIVSRNYTSDTAAFIGTYNGYSGLFGHNASLTAWSPVYINAFGGTSNANVYLGNMYSPILYDLNDTAYYIDPNSTSRVNNLTVAGTLTGNATSAVTLFGSQYLYISPTNPNTLNSGYGNAADNSDIWLNYRGYNDGFSYSRNFNVGNGRGTAYIWGDGTNQRVGINKGQAAGYTLDVGGTIYSNTDVRAPIFYDSDNTGYYVDPNGTSNIASINVNGTITQSGPGRTSIVGPSNYDTRLGSSDLWFWFKSIDGNGSSGYPGAIQFGRNDNVFAWPIVLNPRGGNVGINSYSADYTLHVAGTGYASSDFRAPIFYDSNDTGFYCDPANISNFNTRLQIQAYSAYSPDYAYGLQLGGYAGVTAWNFNPGGSPSYRNLTFYGTGWNGSAVVTRSILTIGNYYGYVGIRNDSPNYELDITGTGYASNDFRAPIFYDSNDTAYYINPNGTPQSINVAGNIECTARSASWAEGIRVWVPTAGTWGGLRITRSSSTGNWAIGYTGLNSTDDLTFYSGTTNTILANLDHSGNWTVGGILAFANSSAYSFGSNYWAGTGGYPGYQYIGGNTRFGFSSTSGAVDVYTDGNFYGGIDYSGANRLVPLFDYNQGGGALYSSILYDTNNTGYYVDPASTSVLNAVNVNGNLNTYAGIVSLNRINFTDNSGSQASDPYCMRWISETSARGNGLSWLEFQLNDDDNEEIRIYGNSCAGYGCGPISDNLYHRFRSNGYAWNAGTHEAGADSRAPIFYDSNDTGYYLDPNSTSNSALRIRGGALHGPNPTWGKYLYVGTDGRVGTTATVAVTNGNLHIDCEDGYGMYLNWYSNNNIYTHGYMGIGDSSASYRLHVYGTGYATSDFRAPIFYDSDDTGYYLNPNGSSNLNGGTANGTWNFTAGTYAAFMYGNGSTSGSSTVGLQVYSTGGNGAIMAFHRGGYYAVNMGLDSDNVIRIGGWSAASSRLQMDMSGNLTMAGNVTAYSDERLKKDWLSLASDFITGLAGIKAGTYTRIDSGERQVGVSAQDIQKLVAEAVTEDAAGMLSVNYGGAALAAAVELAKEAVDLRARVATLEALISKLIKD